MYVIIGAQDIFLFMELFYLLQACRKMRYVFYVPKEYITRNKLRSKTQFCFFFYKYGCSV